MIIQQFTGTPFHQNTRIVVCENTKKAICIDPGERSIEITNYLNENDLELQAITLTHGHLDHVGGTFYLHKTFPDAEIILHKDDQELYYNLPIQPIAMGVQTMQLEELGMKYENPPQLTRNWQNEEIYEVGDLRFKILHCPGHTRGHVVLAELDEKKVFVGDCLFAGSIGRTDLPGGSQQQLLDSVNNKIIPLGDEFIVYSGHGEDTTIGKERETNPFLAGNYVIRRGRFV